MASAETSNAPTNYLAELTRTARREAVDMIVGAIGEDAMRDLRHEGEAMDRDQAALCAIDRIQLLEAQTRSGGSDG